jgi:biopolymer transport protein TolQ
MLLSILTAVPVQPEAVVAMPSQGISFFSMVFGSDIIIQATTLLLIGLSIGCWAVIIVKRSQLKKMNQKNKDFYRKFWHSNTINELIKATSFQKSPALSVFKSGMEEIQKHGKTANLDYIHQNVRRAADDEIYEMEGLMSFLATVGSTSPFIGLFGTVWGILLAFWRIGTTGSTSMTIVGPHIGGALFATALGLMAAIPAVVFYNIFVSKIKNLTKDILDFSEDLNGRIEKEYFIAK